MKRALFQMKFRCRIKTTASLLSYTRAYATTLIVALWSSFALTAAALETPTEERFFIPGHDGTPLDVILNTPEMAGASSSPLPAVLLINPWAPPSDAFRGLARDLASRGYVALSVMPRGMGKSGGVIDVAGTNDQMDLKTLVDWLCQRRDVDCLRIGVAGISYGGSLALLLGALDSRIRTVVSLSGWTDLGGSLVRQNTLSAAWITILEFCANNFGHRGDALNQLIKRFFNHQMSTDELAQWSALRSPSHYVAQLNQRRVPILLQHDLEDSFFWLSDILSFFNDLSTPKQLYVSEGEHSVASYLGAADGKSGLSQRTCAWFDRYLTDKKDKDTREPLPPKILRFPIVNSTREITINRLDDLPIRRVEFTLEEAKQSTWGTLAEDSLPGASSLWKTLASGRENNVGPRLPVLGAVLRSNFHNPSWLKSLNSFDPQKVALFATSMWTTDRFYFGQPHLKIWIAPQASRVQIIAYLYEVDGPNQAKPMVHGAITIETRELDRPIPVELKLRPLSVRLRAGHQFLLAIGTYDQHYMPVSSFFRFDLLLDKSHPATLEMQEVAPN